MIMEVLLCTFGPREELRVAQAIVVTANDRHTNKEADEMTSGTDWDKDTWADRWRDLADVYGWNFKRLSRWAIWVGLVGWIGGMALWSVMLIMDHKGASVWFTMVTLLLVPAAIAGFIGLLVLGLVLRYCGCRRDDEAFFPRINPGHWVRGGSVVAGWLIILPISGALFGYGGLEALHFGESHELCMEACHAAMEPDSVTFEHSPHAQILCVKCHVGPGLLYHVKAKLKGSLQLYSLLTDTYHRPMTEGRASLRPSSIICGQCHVGDGGQASILRECAYFLPDEENSRFNVALSLRVGKTPSDEPYIHWHADPNNKVYYIATDEHRQEIAWVKRVDAQGNETVYRHSDTELSDEQLQEKHPVQQMECYDCHNRGGTHRLMNPQQMLNSALVSGRIDPGIPSIKEQGLAVLSEDYETKAAALAAIEEKLTAYYREEQPDSWTSKQDVVVAAIKAVQDVFSENVFPERKASWKYHPSNLGHLFEKGCARCHQVVLRGVGDVSAP